MRRNQTIFRSPLLAYFVILCLVAQSAYATIPTLETDAGALELRIADGIEANAVAFDDVWHWPDGVSAGSGLVPKDGGGTVQVSTFLSEIIANSVYIIHKNLAFGDGSSSSWFSSLNQMIYYEDGNVFEVLSAATLQLGELSGSGDEEWGINGSSWSVGPSIKMNLIPSGSSGSFLLYASDFHARTNQIILFNGATSTIDLKNSILGYALNSGGNRRFQFQTGNLTFQRIMFNNYSRVIIGTSPVLSENILLHFGVTGIHISTIQDVVISNLEISNPTGDDVLTFGGGSHKLINPQFSAGSIIAVGAEDVLEESYTVNIHISDSSGSSLEGATVVMESYGNVVKNGSTFYRCLEDHTASATFQDDLDANRWIVTSAENAAKAGVTGANAQNGLWVTGSDYEDAEELFSEVTDSEGNISQQIADYKKWVGTSEVLGSFAPYTFTISKAGYVTLTPDLVAPTIIDGTVQPFVEHWQLESGATKRPRAQRHGQ